MKEEIRNKIDNLNIIKQSASTIKRRNLYGNNINPAIDRILKIVNELTEEEIRQCSDSGINAVLGDSYERYELIRDYEDPCGTIKRGVIKTEYQWMARFALLNPGDCKIKKDWFKKVESE